MRVSREAFAQNFGDIVDSVAEGPTGVFRLQQVEGIVGEIGSFILFLGAAGIIIAIAWTGISYLRAGSDEQKAQEAKTRLKWTLVGAAIIMGIGVILATISQILSSGSAL